MTAWRGQRGQATIEVALLLSLLVMPLVFGLVEMGFLFSSHITISAATREGARMGSNLANGGNPLGCGAGQSPNAAGVDPQIIASVERSLTGAGTEIDLANVSEIDIFKATGAGGVSGTSINVWTYALNGGPVIDGAALDFRPSGSPGWQACSRSNVIPADALGVTIKYAYQAKSPLRYFLPGFASWNLTDTTVMVLNATQ
ncbi:MAG TPA: TadE family protein [Candidatus Limnocylindria bacterium]|nr:TadE family protein [Candidatus Limnocylindria bacterium]